MLVTKAAYARSVGVTRQAIDSALRSGLLRVTRDEQGQERIDTEDPLSREYSRPERRSQDTPQAVLADEGPDEGPTKHELEKMKIQEDVYLRRLRRQRESGELIGRDTVRSLFSQLNTILRSELLTLPRRKAAELAAAFGRADATSISQVEVIAQREIYRILESIHSKAISAVLSDGERSSEAAEALEDA